jgi:inward rectifier potassium channel
MNQSDLPRGTKVFNNGGYKTYVVGADSAFFGDGYHYFLRAPWWVSLLMLVFGFIALNIAFAVAYSISGGIATEGATTFLDGLFFSVQTMATIGYGVMHPTSMAANTIVIVESMVGIIVTALATGLVFSKFARSTARVQFSKFAVISLYDGRPMLMFRVGNRRSNYILEAHIRVVLSRTEKHKDGTTFYRLYDLTLVRDRSPAMTRGWTVMHEVDEHSLLFGKSPEQMVAEDLELIVTVAGTDETSMQTVHARHTYSANELKHGHRMVDSVMEMDDGSMLVDMRKFHLVEPLGPR